MTLSSFLLKEKKKTANSLFSRLRCVACLLQWLFVYVVVFSVFINSSFPRLAKLGGRCARYHTNQRSVAHGVLDTFNKKQDNHFFKMM